MSKYLIVIALLTIGLFFAMPSYVQAACICKPIGGDYKVGRWVSESGGACNRNYGVCVLNCIISELDTARCMKRCLDSSLSCNPLEDTKIDVGFVVPTFTTLIGNLIKLLFFVAGLLALFHLLLGGFDWVRSGGDEKKIEAARLRIVNAVIGLVVMVASLSLVIFLEQVVFGGKFCLGISCPINIKFLQLIR